MGCVAMGVGSKRGLPCCSLKLPSTTQMVALCLPRWIIDMPTIVIGKQLNVAIIQNE